MCNSKPLSRPVYINVHFDTDFNTWFSCIFLIFDLILWLLYADLTHFTESIIVSICFSIIEGCHYYYIKDTFYTTSQQFWINIFFLRWLLKSYEYINAYIQLQVEYLPIIYLSITVFPLYVWGYEFVTGTILIWLYNGFNPAWNYTGIYASSDGTVCLSCYTDWVILGIIHLCLSPLVYVT